MPIYNEEAALEPVVTEWLAELNRLEISFVLLAINDGSTDSSGLVLKRLVERYPNAIAPCEKQNGGYGQACRAGYLLAIESGAEWTLQIDSDGQCDPRFFSEFWNRREEADALFGMRTERDDGMLRAVISTGCRIATSFSCGIDLKDANVPYRLIRTQVLKTALTQIPESFDMQNVALTLILKRDASVRWKHPHIRFRNRLGGKTKFGFSRVLSMGWTLLAALPRIGKQSNSSKEFKAD